MSVVLDTKCGLKLKKKRKASPGVPILGNSSLHAAGCTLTHIGSAFCPGGSQLWPGWPATPVSPNCCSSQLPRGAWVVHWSGAASSGLPQRHYITLTTAQKGLNSPCLWSRWQDWWWLMQGRSETESTREFCWMFTVFPHLYLKSAFCSVTVICTGHIQNRKYCSYCPMVCGKHEWCHKVMRKVQYTQQKYM